ncbi:MAG: hypothetical protein ACI8RD_000406 [Bacillariaceae sp.]|jgi:hypothetical protein
MDNGGLIHSNCQHAIIVHKKIDAGKMNEWFTFARVIHFLFYRNIISNTVRGFHYT